MDLNIQVLSPGIIVSLQVDDKMRHGTCNQAYSICEREGENIHYVNDSENFSLAGLVLCSYEGLLSRLDLLKLLGPAGSS